MRYKEENLGRPAVFLLPSLKLKGFDKKRRRIENKIHEFLLKHFDGYTAAGGNIFGFWRSGSREFYGEHKEYKVAFKGKERIPILKRFLAQIAFEMGEKCIYLETGEDSFLIHPDPPKKQGRCKRKLERDFYSED